MKPSQLIPFGQIDDAYDNLHADLEFAYKRAKVLADMLEIPVHESAEVTGTILGLVRGSVERLQSGCKKLREENAYVNDMLENAHNRSKRLESENERLRNRDGNATIILCETTETIPFHQEKLKIIDFGVSDNIYMVERASEI